MESRSQTLEAATLGGAEALYQHAIERCPDGFLALDFDGRVVFVNDAYLRRSGYTRAELIGAEVAFLVLGGRQADIVARLRRLCGGGEYVGESRHVTKDGVAWPLEVTASYHPAEGGRFFAFHRDLTRRKRAAALLEARVELARVAIEGSLDDVMQRTVDVAERLTHSSIGFFHFVDDDQEQLTLNAWSTNTLATMCTAEGKGAHYPISQAGIWVDAFHARAPVAHNDYAAAEHKKGMPLGHAPVTRLLTVPILKGDVVMALLGVGNKPADYDDEDAAAIRELAAFTIDLVARKRAEDELRLSEERFRALFDTMAQGVIYRNADGRIDSVNQAAMRLFGFDESIVGAAYDPRVWDARREDGTALAVDELPSAVALRTGAPARATMGLLNQRTGARVWVDATAIPRSRPGETRPFQVCLVLDDLSDRKAAEESRIEAERREQRLQKLESLGVLAGGVAHDFNNLLAAIVGHLDLACGELERDDAAQIDLEGARAAADRATAICRQMLAYSGRGRFVVGPTTWHELLRDREALALPPAPPNTRVELVIAPGAARIEADASQLQRLVHNLVENAAEALGSAGGVVEVEAGVRRCAREELDACTLGDALPPGAYATLEVRDRGEGMDAATLGRVFDPFFSRRFTGRGLGLAEVLGIVRAHAGAIRVESWPGRGTTVRVYLPCSDPPPGSTREPTPLPPLVGDRPSLRPVLVVDDDDTVRTLCQRLLERGGMATLGAASGAEALEMVQALGGDLELVVLDVSMPGLPGEKVLAELRRDHPELPVIMSSGFTAEVLAPQLAAWGADGFLQKPYDGRRLLETVEAVRRRHGRT